MLLEILKLLCKYVEIKCFSQCKTCHGRIHFWRWAEQQLWQSEFVAEVNCCELFEFRTPVKSVNRSQLGRYESLRIATTLCIQGMVAEMDDWAFKNQARLRYDRFWIKASWQILAEKLSNKNMKQLHRYAAHAETLQEVPDTATSTCNMRCPTMHLLLSSSLMSRSRKDGCARASRPGQLMMVMLFWSILWIAVKQCKA